MDFSYKTDDHKINTLNIVVGSKWKESGANNTLINSIFSKIDDGDGIVSEKEFSILQHIFKSADASVDGLKNNQMLQNSELIEIFRKINNNEINIENLKNGRIDNINPNDYTKESLQKRYPSDKYSFENNAGSIVIKDKATGKSILMVAQDKDGTHITADKIFRSYDKNGNLTLYRGADNEDHYPMVDDFYGFLQGNISADKFVSSLKKINSENVVANLESIKKISGADIEEVMEASGKMKKNTKFKQQILNYLSRRLEEHYEYNSNFNVENSQVTNKFHKGDTYSIQGKSDKVTITNKDNGKVYILDLDKLTKELPLDEKVKIKKFISQLPGEVMMDLAIELDSFKNKADFVDRIIFKNASGVYNGWSDSITLGMNGSDSIDSLVHELGHAIDNTTRHLLFESSHYEKFKKAFEEGLAAFTSLGYKRSKGTGDKNVGFGYVKKEGFITERAANYATTNIKEMFAECYQYLMTGTCLSADMLEDFFPECLSIADEMLEVIRNLPDEKRHKRS